jgi:tetratricopeptide (TPR) repeat protein
MKRLINILVFFCLSLPALAQEETSVVDSLLNVLPTQEGRDKVLTMIELTWEFYDVSYDDCIDWGEKAIKEAQNQGFKDLEAKANYALGIQYAFNGDMDLSKVYLKNAYDGFTALEDTKNAFESLWNIATYEMSFGSIDTAYSVYEKALSLAHQLNDTSAFAYVLSNMGLIWYKRGNSEVSLRYYGEAKNLFETIGADLDVLRLRSNIAVIYLERDRYDEARRLFWSILPKFEDYGDNYYAFLACKNMGIIYENTIVNYDSALFYFQRALDYVGSPMSYKENEVFLNNEISGALVEMANIMERQGNHAEAIAKYEEALAMAESSGYLYGQMEAFVGLGKIYGKLGQAQKSLQYFNHYFDLEKKSGLVQLRPTFRKVLAIDYARLGMMEELDAELSNMENAISEAQRENTGLYDENEDIQVQLSALLQQYDSQNTQIQTLQTQRNHYRLAFFGLLSIAIFTLVLLAAYKIVRKKRTKV